MRNSDDLGVLIVGFLRAENIERLIALSIDNSIRNIYLTIDGPRNPSDSTLQDSIINKLDKFSNISKLNLHVWKRRNNCGSAVSVIKSIDWIASQEESFIVLEDDLIPNDDFYDFSKFCSSAYRNQSEVLMWSGNRFFSEENPLNYPLPVHFPLIWGWGTWSGKWIEIRKGILEQNHSLLAKKNLSTQSFLAAGKIRAQGGRIDAWDLPLASYMFAKNRVCILPPVNLVSNVGSDLMATHTLNSSWPLFMDTEKLSIPSMDLSIRNPKASKVEERLIIKKIYKVKIRHAFSRLLVQPLDAIRGNKFRFDKPLKERLELVND